MTDEREKRRAAARCDGCGEIGIVRVWPSGRIEPIGGPSLCNCSESDLRILDSDEGWDDCEGLGDL